MILTVVGKPGGGKSLYALRHIIKVLTETENAVVTNLAIKLPELHAYLARVFPHKDIDTPRRLRLLDERQSRYFWLYRIGRDGCDVDLNPVTVEQAKHGTHVDYTVITRPNRAALESGQPRPLPGVCYIIDECHVFFDSRAWTETGLSLTFYNSQHRKLDDDVIFVTQFLELIDKRVKGFSQEFIYLRNNSAEKILTLFRGPSYFTAKHYQRPPSGLSDYPSEVHRFTLDVPLANCYDTSAGVGISGVGKPETKKKKGISLFWLAVPFVAFMYFLFAAPDWLASAMLNTKVGAQSAETLGLVKTADGDDPEAVSLERPSVSPVGGGTMFASSLSDSPEIWPTGYVVAGRRVTVFMSDGTTRTERDRELTDIQRNSITLDGKKLFFRPRPRDPVPSPSPAPTIPPTPQEPVLGADDQADEVTRFDTAGEIPGKSTYRL